MHLKDLFLICLVSSHLASCALSSPLCDSASAKDIGLKDGEMGRQSRGKETFKRCKSQELILTYSQSHDVGLKKFCSYQNGFSRADLGLLPVKACNKVQNYQAGYSDALEQACSVERALSESSSYSSIYSPVCLENKKYKKVFLSNLKKTCSKKLAWELGASRKTLNGFCALSPSHKSFLQSYEAAKTWSIKKESKELVQKNKAIREKLNALKKELKSLQKNRLPAQDLKKEKIKSLKIEINILSSKMLDHVHQIELNKKTLQN